MAQILSKNRAVLITHLVGDGMNKTGHEGDL
jgi:hypothetical protein